MRRKVNTYKYLLSALIFCLFFTSCNQLNQAFRETFELDNPKKEITGKHALQEDNVKANNMTDGDSELELEDYGHEIVEIEKSTHEVNLFEDEKQLVRAKQRLQDLFPGKSLRIYPPHIYFEKDRIRLIMVDPNIPENIDWYYYHVADGSWSREEPVKTSIHTKRNSVAFDKMDFSIATQVYHQVKVKSELVEGAKLPTTIYLTINQNPWSWNANILFLSV